MVEAGGFNPNQRLACFQGTQFLLQAPPDQPALGEQRAAAYVRFYESQYHRGRPL